MELDFKKPNTMESKALNPNLKLHIETNLYSKDKIAFKYMVLVFGTVSLSQLEIFH